MFSRKSLLIAVLFLFALVLLIPVSVRTDRVDGYMLDQMQKRQIPGIALIVLEGGNIVKVKGYGLSNIEHNVPVHPHTLFQSASVGKQFTAMAVMILTEEGKLDLDDPISKYLAGSPPHWEDITIRHLLTHTSGIPEYEDRIDYRRDYTEKDFVMIAAESPLDFAPGEHWSYSNTGYVLLGIIIREASGSYWGDFVRDRIFVPLKMETARVISEADIIPNRAAGYRIVEGEIKNQEWVSPSLNTTADGTLYLSVLDMAKWDSALYTEKLLERSNRDRMWTPTRLSTGKEVNYGFGWALNKIRGHRIVEHAGHWQGFSLYIARYIDDSLTVVVFTNQADLNPGIITHNVAGLYDPELRPLERKGIKLSREYLDPLVGRYESPAHTIIDVSRENLDLIVTYGKRKGKEFHAESETVFFSIDQDELIEFVKNEKGRVTHLLYDWGVVEEARRID